MTGRNLGAAINDGKTRHLVIIDPCNRDLTVRVSSNDTSIITKDTPVSTTVEKCPTTSGGILILVDGDAFRSKGKVW